MKKFKHLKKFESFYDDENKMDDYLNHGEELEKKQKQEEASHQPSEIVKKIAALPHFTNPENVSRLIQHLSQKLDVVIKYQQENDLHFTHPRDRENVITVIFDSLNGEESIDAEINTKDLINLLKPTNSNEVH